MDIATLRGEIKTWEREFRESHGRDPTVQEIKDRPDVAAKYKLYKQLSKQQGTSTRASTSVKPRPGDHRRIPSPTGARDEHRASASSILSVTKHHAVITKSPALTSNPFSPVKHKGKARDKANRPPGSPPDPIPLLLLPNAQANPFLTPSKSKPRPTPRKLSSAKLEDDPFPLIADHLRASSSKAPPLVPLVKPESEDTPGTPGSRSSGDVCEPLDDADVTGRPVEDAVTRARKRLRGEHVEPSPVKEKRARTALERVASVDLERGSLFSTLRAVQAEDSDEEPVRREKHQFDDEFVAETPAKPIRNGKAFVNLFDEAIPAPSFAQAKPPTTTSRNAPGRTKSAGAGLLSFGFSSGRQGKAKVKQRAMSPHSEGSDGETAVVGRLLAGSIPSASSRMSQVEKPGKVNAMARKLLPGKNDLSEGLATVEDVEADADQIPGKKRTLSVSGTDVVRYPDPKASRTTSLPLLPPSPPPASSNGSRYTGEKGKAGAKALARKKTKLLEQLRGEDELSDDGGDIGEEIKVKEIPWSWNTHLRESGISNLTEDESAASEPELDMAIYRPAHSPTAEEDASDEQGQFEVNLPEHLRRMLALSPGRSAPYQEDEEKLARGLIYGRREGHYDPSRGGEIWGAGEVSTGDEGEDFEIDERRAIRPKDHEEDEDWEGEPVPWEVGEL